MIHDDTICLLGEGPLWHPGRGELFWFDILGRRLHRKGQSWRFPTFVSAAGWVDDDTLLVASADGLYRFTLSTGDSDLVAPLEADNAVTRSNDGRADPYGGFWIGTMGREAEQGAGSIWRYYKGEVRRLVPDVTVSNAICFHPDGHTAFYVDTHVNKVMRWRLSDPDGWPEGEAEVWLDLSEKGPKVDGAVIDAAGNFWTAHWGAGQVACYDASGTFQEAIDLPAIQTTCPAFGGEGLRTIFCTSAAVGIPQSTLAEAPLQGQTFAVETGHVGQAEHRVIL
ncbi:gluconolactonase [Wenxinia marina]|uniref:SMP-30/gluconolactonase/LRE family protein n=1 Tax=Wenxinia marina TaxID=390641 RepID=UPI0003644B1A|nr:SMP-30/gluconolactonase/LRE family protein [Wenxinia marina]GGL51976.1 gluconolactonase [Wenxinia marina]